MRVNVKIKGYMSVEAALLFPVVIMIVMMMMGMSFYVYDRCVIKSCVYDALLLGANEEMTGNLDRDRQMKERLEKSVNETGISLSDVKIDCDAGLMKVKATADAKVNLIWITSTSLPIHYEKELTRLDVVKTMRFIRHGKNILEGN